MKARVKATGEIGIVANIDLLFGNKGYRYQSDEVEIVNSYAEVDADNDTEIDYWTRLEHQAVITAMQGILGNQTYTKSLLETSTSAKDARNIIVDASYHLAHALVEKMKEERK